MRKTNLARILARRVDGIFVSEFEQGEIGPDLFRHACLLGLEAASGVPPCSRSLLVKRRNWLPPSPIIKSQA
jgi:hypothetical protein